MLLFYRLNCVYDINLKRNIVDKEKNYYQAYWIIYDNQETTIKQ